MKTIIVILSVWVLALSGCNRNEFVGRSQAEILAGYNNEVATVVKYGGPSQGPYNDVGGFVGNPGQAINISWIESGNEVKVAAPALPGYYYQLDRFGTKNGQYFWILIKLKNRGGV